MVESVAQAAQLLRSGFSLCDERLVLDMGGFCLEIRSNSAGFLARLAHYFDHVVVATGQPMAVVEAYDCEVIESALAWRDWAREPGKTGRKDAYIDLDGGRLVLKVRTGMLFLQSREALIAAGPCAAQDNQVINFINSQYMNWLQQRGWLICHAAGLDIDGMGIGIAGLSGGGKSTLMLSLMDYAEVRYLTNDRLFVRRAGDCVYARGIAKLPRINPGTIVHNPALHGLIDEQRRAELLALPRQQLWELEEKYDVMINELYGDARIADEMILKAFVVLNWSHESEDRASLQEVELAGRRDLLPAIMKSPGPFFQDEDGTLLRDTAVLDEAPYLDVLRDVTILEARGRVDIPALQAILYRWVGERQ